MSGCAIPTCQPDLNHFFGPVNVRDIAPRNSVSVLAHHADCRVARLGEEQPVLTPMPVVFSIAHITDPMHLVFNDPVLAKQPKYTTRDV